MERALYAEGTYSKCKFYEPEEAGRRADVLIGKGSEIIIRPAEVLNFALYGYPYEKGQDCA